MKLYQKITALLVFLILSNISIGQDYTMRIFVAKPKVKATDNKENLRVRLRSQLEESIASLSDYVVLVEREYIKQIEFRRKSFKRKTDNSNIGASAMIGANYILESVVSEVNFDEGNQKVEKLDKKKNTIYKKVNWNTVSYIVDLELIDVETGEVKYSHRIKTDGLDYELIDYGIEKDALLIKNALTESFTCLNSVLRYMILSSQLVYTPILNISEEKKGKAKKIIVDNGINSPFFTGQKFDILKSYSKEINGANINRLEKIGEAKFRNKFLYNSEFTVSKGGDKIYSALNESTTLYCLPTGIRKMETCNEFLTVAAKSKTKKSFANAKKNVSAETQSKSSSTKSTKNTKTVQRKSGK